MELEILLNTNAAINSEGSGDVSSTQYNQIWSSANSFFRNRQKFACFLEHWPEILIAVNWQWSLGKNSSLSKNWDYWEIAENMVKMHNLVNKSCCKPRLQSKSPLSKKLRLLRKTEIFLNHTIFISKFVWHNEYSQKIFLNQKLLSGTISGYIGNWPIFAWINSMIWHIAFQFNTRIGLIKNSKTYVCPIVQWEPP